jgi:hypothetical protein
VVVGDNDARVTVFNDRVRDGKRRTRETRIREKGKAQDEAAPRTGTAG